MYTFDGIDQWVLSNFSYRNLPAVYPFFLIITMLGEALLWIVALAGYLLVGREKKIAAALLIALAFSVIINDDLKVIIQRPRPERPALGEFLSYKSYSFPSGHAQTAFLIAAFLAAFLARRYGIIAYGLATAVALSRLYLDVHYFTDVVAGALAGIAIAWLALYALRLAGLYEMKGLISNGASKHVKTDESVIRLASLIVIAGFILALGASLLASPVASLAICSLAYLVLLVILSRSEKSRA